MLGEILMHEDTRQIIAILSSAAGGFFMGAEWGVKRERKFIAYMLDRLGLRVLHPDGNLKKREEMEIVFHLDPPVERDLGLEMYRETIEDRMAKEARARLNAGVK